MKKLFVSLTALIFLMSAFIINIHATSTEQSLPLLVDDAGLLSNTEEESLLSHLEQVSDKYDFDIVIWIIEDYTEWQGVYSSSGVSMTSLADDIYDYNGYGRGSNKDGCLLLISMKDRSWHISTCGYGITAITDAGLDAMSERFCEYFRDDNYPAGFECFVSLCDDYLAQAKNGAPYDSDNLPRASFDTTSSLLFASAVGLITALVTIVIMKGKMKTVQHRNYASDYIKDGSMNISKAGDLFLFSRIDKTAKPKESSSGSSTHRSSSGTSHGGGGGHF